MSVLTLDPQIFNYIGAGIEKAAYNRTVDINYNYTVSQHFNYKDIEKEVLRLIKSWAEMNQKSYSFKYKDELADIAPFIKRGYLKSDYTPFQWLKYLQCLQYNIEPEHWQLTEAESADFKLLGRIIADAMAAIIDSLEPYKKAKYAEI